MRPELGPAGSRPGWFSTVNDALGALPDPQLAEQAPPGVRDAVTFGRPPRD